MLLKLSLIIILGVVSSTCAFNLEGIPTVFTENDAVLSAIADDVANQFAKEYLAFRKTGIESSKLQTITRELMKARGSSEHMKHDYDNYLTGALFFTCTTCRATVRVLHDTFLGDEGELNGPNRDQVAKEVTLELCKRFNIQSEEVCAGSFDLHWPYIDFIMQNTEMESRTFCGMFPINMCQVKQESFNFTINIDPNGPAINGPKSGVPARSDQDYKVLHITDIHYDPEYKVGGLANCPEVMCCRQTTNVPENQKAGYWSDYGSCDSPWHMIDAAFDSMRQNHPKIDYIYQTGDNVPHNVWSTTKEYNIMIDTKINELIAEKFKNIPVFPCAGNHDHHPADQYSPPHAPEALNSKWFYEHLSKQWSKFLPAETMTTIKRGAYYTTLAKPGFRIIALNSMECYMYNWWVFYNGYSTTEQLNWLHDTLLAAEKSGEYVHILMHIPSGTSECWNVWAREANRIFERFHHIIGGIFTGHTHKNQIYVHYSSKGQHATGIEWNGGSLTTYSNKNPNYNFYEVDPKTLQVLEIESWLFNLTEANALGQGTKPRWYKSCEFSKDFTADTSPAGINGLLEQMAEKPDLLRKMWRRVITEADPKLAKGCNDKCLLKFICQMTKSVNDEKTRCKALQEKLRLSLANEETTSTPKPGGDGAASLTALKLSSLFALLAFIKFVL